MRCVGGIFLLLALLLAGCSGGVQEILKSSDTEMVVLGKGDAGFRRGFATGDYAVCISGSQGSGGFVGTSSKTISLQVEAGTELLAIDGMVSTDWASSNHTISVPLDESLASFKVSADEALRWIVRMEPAENAVGCGN